MANLIKIITDKPNWQNKINDKTIVDKWKSELQAIDINPICIDLAIDILKDHVTQT